MGMERVIKVGDGQKTLAVTDSDFNSNVARCPRKGPLLIESKFESVYDIPIEAPDTMKKAMLLAKKVVSDLHQLQFDHHTP